MGLGQVGHSQITKEKGPRRKTQKRRRTHALSDRSKTVRGRITKQSNVSDSVLQKVPETSNWIQPLAFANLENHENVELEEIGNIVKRNRTNTLH